MSGGTNNQQNSNYIITVFPTEFIIDLTDLYEKYKYIQQTVNDIFTPLGQAQRELLIFLELLLQLKVILNQPLNQK